MNKKIYGAVEQNSKFSPCQIIRWPTWILMLVSVVAGHILFACEVQALNLVIPTNYASAFGNYTTLYPFRSSAASRYQQVYDAKEFAVLQSPKRITGIAFRWGQVSATEGSYSGESVELRLSTTSAKPDALSTDFTANVGPDETVVYSDVHWEGFSYFDVGKFAFSFTFSQPFLYDPTRGNLLLEVRMPSYYYAPSYLFDAVQMDGDSVSRLFASASGATSGDTNTIGVITQFEFEDAPPAPQILLSDESFGFHAGQFGFKIKGSTNQVVVVEGSTNLLNWLPLKTNTLSTSTLYFSDPDSGRNGNRYYRLR